MKCASGLGSCLCYTPQGDWSFQVTFRFPGEIEGFDVDVAVERTNMVNCQAITGAVAARENLNYDALLTEPGTRYPAGFGAILEEPGQFVFLNAIQLTRELRQGDVIKTEIIETIPYSDSTIELINRLYPTSQAIKTHSEWSRRVQIPASMIVQMILPPTEGAEKIAHGGLTGQMVEDWQWPATYDGQAGTGVDGLVRSNRHLLIQHGNQFALSGGDVLGAGFAALTISPAFGPFRANARNVFPESDEFPPYQTVYFGNDFGGGSVQHFTRHRGFDYYFKPDYYLGTVAARYGDDPGYALMPGMDWFAKRYWEGKTVTIKGTVTRP